MQNTRNTESTRAAGVKGSDGAALVKVSTDQGPPTASYAILTNLVYVFGAVAKIQILANVQIQNHTKSIS